MRRTSVLTVLVLGVSTQCAGDLFLYDGESLSVGAGDHYDNIWLYGTATLTVDGGIVDRVVGCDSSVVNYYGIPDALPYFFPKGNSTFNFFAGKGVVSATGQAVSHFYGGNALDWGETFWDFSWQIGNFFESEDAEYHIYGYDFVPPPPENRALFGNWADGTRFAIGFCNNSWENAIYHEVEHPVLPDPVPLPGAALLGVLGIGYAGMRLRRGATRQW